MMLKLKSCPRCNCDIRIDRDIYGWYEECIQCGYLGFLEKIKETGEYIPIKAIDKAVCFDDKTEEKDDVLDKLVQIS